MHDAIAEELRVLEAGNHPEDTRLLGPGEVGLEPHEVVCGSRRGLGPELHDGPGTPSRAGVDEPHRLERPEAQGVDALAGDLLDGLAGLEEVSRVEVVGDDAAGLHELPPERLVGVTLEGAVEVVATLGPLVAGLGEHDVAVDGLGVDYWCRRVVEREGVAADGLADLLEERLRAEWPRADDTPPIRDFGRLLANHLDEVV